MDKPESPDDEIKKLAEAIREMSAALKKLNEVHSELLSYNRKARNYVRISGDSIVKLKAMAIERKS